MENVNMTAGEKELRRLLESQENLTKQQNFLRATIYSPKGFGKTHLLRTCPFPIHVDSFDPSGSQTLSDLKTQGKVIADTRYEIDTLQEPKAFDTWVTEFYSREKIGYWQYISTYAIDSLTMFQDAIMNKIRYEASKAAPTKEKKALYKIDDVPWQDMYTKQMNLIYRHIRVMLNLPCHVVLLCHDDQQVDKEGNAKGNLSILTVGKLRKKLPTLFSELWKLEIHNFVTGERRLLTQPISGTDAGTRIGHGGKLEKYEVANIRQILKKCGLPYEDKERIKI